MRTLRSLGHALSLTFLGALLVHTISSLRLKTDSLHLTHLSHILLDATHLDAKKRSLVDMPEAREDLFKLVLGNKDIVERLKEGKCKIVVY